MVNKYTKSLEEYVNQHPNATKIPVQRRFLKQINPHMVLLDQPFPIKNISYNLNLSIIKQKSNNEIEHNFNLIVYGDYVFCLRCEFLLFYKVGDSFFVVRFY